MYRQILIHPEDTNYQRIVWRSSPDTELQEFRLRTVTYGTTSAPFLALRVIQQLAEDDGSEFPLAVPVLLEQTYVDDYLFGANDIPTTLSIRDQTIALLKKGGFNLRKWIANDSKLLISLSPRDHGIMGFNLQSEESAKILGLSWNPDQDFFQFKFQAQNSYSLTKRQILSVIARLYNPLGWLTPVLIIAKIFLQNLWLIKKGWDEELSRDHCIDWMEFLRNLPAIDSIRIPRWTGHFIGVSRVEVHGFCDASTKAYAAVIYLRVITSSGSTKISLLLSKSKVTSLKTVSIPRLELCAAVLLSRLLSFVKRELKLAEASYFGWSDSTVTLAWLLRSPSTLKTFVANRVSEIQSLHDFIKWHHAPSEENPADCASRGISMTELAVHPLWWTGPPWLSKSSESWPKSFSISNVKEESLELRRILNAFIMPSWNLGTRYSSWKKLLRITALILNAVDRMRKRLPENTTPSSIHPSDIQRARIFWIRKIQADTFSKEIRDLQSSNCVSKSSSLVSLLPFLDNDGLLRARGRLQHAPLPDSVKNPIILTSHPIVKLIIRDIHETLLHTSSQLLLSQLTEEYWLLRPRQIIRAVLHQCVRCARENARVPEQLMGNLPDFRITRTVRPFIHTGVDYAGPFQILFTRKRGSKTHKAYIAVFVCLTVKAVHLELVHDYSTDAFLAAFQRFVSRRGLPSAMYSDNGTTFQDADKELKNAYHHAVSDSKLQSYVINQCISWHFIPPAAPHFGGLWEAAVKSMKYHLRRQIGLNTLTADEMTTLLCRVEACLNSRPLVPLTDTIDDFNALTPGHFLIGTRLISTPEPSVLTIQENRLSRWQLLQRILEHAWHSWRHDYLHTLQQRTKWRHRQQLIKIGQMVLLHEPRIPPSHWALGRIVACHPSTDGLVRVVTIRSASSEFKRPITKLCFLPIPINEQIKADRENASDNDHT